MQLPVLEDLLPLEGRRVLVRVDFNVPLARGPDGSQQVADDFRIRAAVPTLEWLVGQGASVTACSHLGRPKGAPDDRYDMAPVRARLEELVPGVALLDNLRFDAGEEENDPAFVERLVEGQDAYVNDAFGASHRAHASIVGPPGRLPSAAGRLLAREVAVLTGALESPARPLVGILGGAKVAGKLGVVKSLLEKVDALVVGGGMAYTFLAAAGCTTGGSIVDHDSIDACRELLAAKVPVHLPVDHRILAPGGRILTRAELDGIEGRRRSLRHVVASKARVPDDGGEIRVCGRDVPHGWTALDIGPATAEMYRDVIAGAATVLWNGPMGVFEDPRLEEGTRAVAEAVASCPGFTVVGGGDSAAALEKFGLAGSVDHLSTGGGATLELIEYGDLPGLAALRCGAGVAGASGASGGGSDRGGVV
jgi:phosphoglycerate kinase